METYEHLPRHYVLLNRYYIGRVLGQGGFGVTYLARDLKLDDRVAIKEFLPREQCHRLTDHVTVRPHDGERTESFRYGLTGFLDEAKTLARLTGHPNILSVKDFDEANGTGYLVMEYISGMTLKHYLAAQGGRIPYDTAVNIILHVMAGLRKVHSNGFLHRDVSPDNIMISSQGPIKLLDFGSARYAIGEHSRSLSVVLKPGYSPEEQYRTRGKQDTWTDVYSVSATLYRCITGQVPPPALDRMADDELIAPSALCPELPQRIEAAILKGLAIRAADRFQTIDEFQQALLDRPQPVTTTAAANGTVNVATPAPAEPAQVTKSVAGVRVADVQQKGQEVPVRGSFWDRVLGRTAAQRSVASVSILATIGFVLWLVSWIARVVNRSDYRNLQDYFSAFTYMGVEIVFFFTCYRVAAQLANRRVVRWAAAAYLVSDWIYQAYWVARSSDFFDSQRVRIEAAIELISLLFMVPILFGIQRRAVRVVLIVASFVAICWQEYDVVRSTDFIAVHLINLACLAFLALSWRFGLPDELARDGGIGKQGSGSALEAKAAG